MNRLETEQAFHDRQAARRARTFDESPSRLIVDADAYLDHAPWIRPAFAQLGEVQNSDVLDFGCGHGMMAVVLAQAGARVASFDWSSGYRDEANRRAQANGVSIDCIQANGEHLPYDDHAFDAIWGNAILHHLDLTAALTEVRRILRPTGVAVFCEPLGDNPYLSLVRQMIGGVSGHQTPDEHPLRRRDWRLIQSQFPGATLQGYGLIPKLPSVDAFCLRRYPLLHTWCRYGVITLRGSCSATAG